MPQDHAQVTRALDVLAKGLAPFVEREMQAVYKDRWPSVVQDSFRGGRGQPNQGGDQPNWDAHSLLTVMWDQWNSVFRHRLGHAERSLVSELRTFRNQWAHQEAFEFDDTYRVYDSAERLLAAVESPEAQWLSRGKRELLRTEFDRELPRGVPAFQSPPANLAGCVYLRRLLHRHRVRDLAAPGQQRLADGVERGVHVRVFGLAACLRAADRAVRRARVRPMRENHLCRRLPLLRTAPVRAVRQARPEKTRPRRAAGARGNRDRRTARGVPFRKLSLKNPSRNALKPPLSRGLRLTDSLATRHN